MQIKLNYMKRLLMAFAFLSLLPVGMAAQGWPARYGGVMLQGFYWDSYEDTQWANLTSQADELSRYFNLIWVPNSATTSSTYHNSQAKTMGYDPCFWLRHTSSFGSEADLRAMVAAFKAKGTGIIADVVINHKNGLNSWADFPDESVTGQQAGKVYTLTWDNEHYSGICHTDEANSKADSPVKGQLTGNADTGDDFDGYRDLDHTNALVQQNVKTYLDYLKDELGYAGFRYDMVKGYAPFYLKLYNESARPEFSVGEYWDGSYDAVAGWINGTDGAYKSAAFDFPLKDGAIKAFADGNFTAASNYFANKGLAGDGVHGMNRYAVTFVDNHDTYEKPEYRLNRNVLAANAFILAMPGTPCIFLKHWMDSKEEIKKMVEARKRAGITNQSTIIAEAYDTDGDGYYMTVKGRQGTVLCMAGYVTGADVMGYDLVSSGENYAYYLKMDDVQAADDNIDIYVKADGQPYLYAWDETGAPLNGNYPGQPMSQVTLNGEPFYHFTTATSPINIILSYGSDDTKTNNIEGIDGDRLYYFTNNNATDFTGLSYDPVAHTAFCELPAGYGVPSAWAWKGGDQYTGGQWPGESCTLVAPLAGNNIYQWTYTGTLVGEPESIIFSYNGGQTQTENLAFADGGYYAWQNGTAHAMPSPLRRALPAFGQTGADRVFTAGQRSTICLPFSLDAGAVQQLGGKVYQMSSLDADGILHFTEAETIVAFHPYLFVADATGKPFSAFKGWIWHEGTARDEAVGGFHFVGNMGNRAHYVSDATKTYYSYGAADGQFYEIDATNGLNLNGYRCCFYKEAGSQGAKPVAISLDGSTTGISEVMPAGAPTDDAWYTLSGQRVSSPTRGVFIHNGKKVIIR